MTITSNVIMTSKEAAACTGGTSTCEWSATGVSIDTRTIAPGDVFIALQGEHSDGHDYVQMALDKGAAAAVISHGAEKYGDNAPLLIVDDTLKALEKLGKNARGRTGAKIIGVTGSVGKTGTKEMLATAFSTQGQVHASKASYNNHWGVPFSLSEMHAGTDYGIFEMGMNHIGEITPLSEMVKPDIAIITTVAPVHMANFNSVEEIALAKAEIFDGMGPGGAAILNCDNEWFGLLKEKAEGKGLRVFGFGEKDGAHARLTECLEAANGSRVKADIGGEVIEFSLQIPGRHIVHNALSVLMAVKVLDGDIKAAAQALSKIEPIKGRGKREFIDIGDPDNPVTLIDESYNASPVAMRAAFKVLALIDPGRGGRRIAVLGDMYELGKDAAQIHADLSLPLQAADVQLVYTCGPLMKNLYDNLPQDRRGGHEDDNVKMAKIVPEVLTPGDVVMVKGSRGGGEKPRMQTIVEALRELPNRKSKKKKDDIHAL